MTMRFFFSSISCRLDILYKSGVKFILQHKKKYSKASLSLTFHDIPSCKNERIFRWKKMSLYWHFIAIRDCVSYKKLRFFPILIFRVIFYVTFPFIFIQECRSFCSRGLKGDFLCLLQNMKI